MTLPRESFKTRQTQKIALFAAVLFAAVAGVLYLSNEFSWARGPDGSGTSVHQDGASSGSLHDAVYRVDTDDPVVFLTIDDGATRDPAMVDVLDDAGVQATLFLTNQYVGQDADFFRRLRDETGSPIENHTLDHPDLAGQPSGEQRRQICATSEHFEEQFDRRPTMLRPPYGSFDDETLRTAEECGITHVVHWTAEIVDGDIHFAVGDELRPGDIVLMHFDDQFDDDIERFVDEAQESGLEPALLEDYLT